MEEYIKEGFYYSVSLKNKKGVIYKDVKIFYYGIDIYTRRCGLRIDVDILFKNVVDDYKRDFLK